MENLDNLSVAERYYKKHLLAVQKYEEKNRDKIREKNRNYFIHLKNDNFDKYTDLLDYHKNHYNTNKDIILDKSKQYYTLNKEKKKLYYLNVVKPRNQQLKLIKSQT
jgi:hypothetical protein